MPRRENDEDPLWFDDEEDEDDEDDEEDLEEDEEDAYYD